MTKSTIIPVGTRFNRLIVTGPIEYRNSRAHFPCRCDCGAERTVRSEFLRSGVSKSCGCYSTELLCGKNARRGHPRAKELRLTYSSWRAMLSRCTRPSSNAFSLYGGRGISVCEAWKIFDQFVADMGERPSRQHSIDRIDSDGSYEPSNCRWATVQEQLENRRNTLRIEFNGKTQTMTQWASELGIEKATLWHRLYKYKWPIARALSAPVRDWGR